MGNIRHSWIKRLAESLVERYKDQFSKDYQENKKKVAELTDVQTAQLRNRIAGYVTRLVARRLHK